MEDGDIEIELLLAEPKNEKIELLLTEPKNEEYHLDECLGGIFDHSHQVEDEHCTLYLHGGIAEQAFTEQEVEDFLEPSMLGSVLPWGALLHGPRGTRTRSQSWKEEVSHLFGSLYPYTSGGRKNNDHWSQDEVIKLVDGVSMYGVGKWKKVKEGHFSTSIRTKAHLKDKWRNLVKTCTKEEPATYWHLEQSLIQRIREINVEDPYPKQRHA